MLPTMLNDLQKCNEELREKAEGYITSVNRIYEKAMRDTLRLDVERILKEKPDGWEKQISGLMENEEHPEAMQADYALIVLKKVYRESSVLCTVSSLDELQELYQKTVFCLRRIEMDMPIEAHKDFGELMRSRNFTKGYLLAVLNGGRIYRTLDTAYKLSELLIKMGYESCAEEIIMWLKNQLGNK